MAPTGQAQQREQDEATVCSLFYLCAKGIDEHVIYLQDAVLWEQVKNITNPSSTLSKLLRLSEPTEGDYHQVSKPPEYMQSFGEFVSLVPEWSDPTLSYVFHRDHPKVNRPGQPNCLVQHFAQRSGLCYLHAPATTLSPWVLQLLKCWCIWSTWTNWLRMDNAKILHDHTFHNGDGSW